MQVGSRRGNNCRPMNARDQLRKEEEEDRLMEEARAKKIREILAGKMKMPEEDIVRKQRERPRWWEEKE